MTVNIYADEMLFINFSVNFLIIELTKKILAVRLSLARELFTAFCVSLAYTLIVISPYRAALNFMTMLALSLCELVFLFKPLDIWQLMRYTIAFKLVSFCVNAVIFLVLNYFTDKFSYIVLLISFGITYASYIVLNILKKGSSYHSIDIYCSNKIININALVDTGNLLIEPISNKPVIVAEYSALKAILPSKLVEIYENKRESNLMEIVSAISEDSFRKSLRIIPFRSVGNEKGMMIGFVADSVKIDDKIINKPIIGICRFNLSKNGLYSALISPRHLGGI